MQISHYLSQTKTKTFLCIFCNRVIWFFFSETCRCPKVLYANYWVHAPYLNQSEDGNIGGIFPQIIKEMAHYACSNCTNGHGETLINMETNGRGGTAHKSSLVQVLEDIDDTSHISFPIHGNKHITKYLEKYTYICLVESPGVAFITANSNTASQATWLSIIQCLPLVGLLLMMCFVAGILMWAVVSGLYGRYYLKWYVFDMNHLYALRIKNTTESYLGIVVKQLKQLQRKTRQKGFTLKKPDLFHSMEVLFPEYFQNISIPRTTSPYYGTGQNCGNWIFKPFSTTFENISIP